MSVINKMLNDLEARQGQTVASSDYQPPARKSGRLIGLVLICILAAGAGGYYFSSFGEALESVEKLAQKVSDESHEEHNTSPVEEMLSRQSSAEGRIPQETSLVDKVEKVEKRGGNAEISNDDEVATPASQVVRNLVKAAAETKSAHALVKNEPVKASLSSESASPSAIEEQVEAPTVSQQVQVDEMLESQTNVPEQTMSVKVSQVTPEQNVVSLKAGINAALSHGQAGEAINLLEALLQVEPNNLNARKQLASLYFGENQIDRAITMLQRAMEADPDDKELDLLLARIYQSLSQPQKALDVLKGAKVNPNTPSKFFELRAALAQQTGNDQLALDDYQHLVLQNASDARWWLGQGIAADKLGQNAIATVSYQEVIHLSQLSQEVEEFVSQRLLVLGGTQ